MLKNLTANAGDTGDLGSTSGSGRSPGGGNGNPLQHSCPENPMDMGARGAVVHGVTKELDTTEHTHTCILLLVNSSFPPTLHLLLRKHLTPLSKFMRH